MYTILYRSTYIKARALAFSFSPTLGTFVGALVCPNQRNGSACCGIAVEIRAHKSKTKDEKSTRT